MKKSRSYMLGGAYFLETGFNFRENSLKGVSGHRGTPHLATGIAGLP